MPGLYQLSYLALHWRSPYSVNIFVRGRQSEVMKCITNRHKHVCNKNSPIILQLPFDDYLFITSQYIHIQNLSIYISSSWIKSKKKHFFERLRLHISMKDVTKAKDYVKGIRWLLLMHIQNVVLYKKKRISSDLSVSFQVFIEYS